VKELKCAFVLLPAEGSGLPSLLQSRLNAPRILQVMKVGDCDTAGLCPLAHRAVIAVLLSAWLHSVQGSGCNTAVLQIRLRSPHILQVMGLRRLLQTCGFRRPATCGDVRLSCSGYMRMSQLCLSLPLLS
jgi:hypothetical protein